MAFNLVQHERPSQSCKACDLFVLIEGNGIYHTCDRRTKERERAKLAERKARDEREETKRQRVQAEIDRQHAEQVAQKRAQEEREADARAVAARRRAEALAANEHAKAAAKAKAHAEAYAQVYTDAAGEVHQLREQLRAHGVEVDPSIASSLFEDDRDLSDFDDNGRLKPNVST